MAAPKGFRSWQEYFDRHIAECENCAPYFQGEGYMSVEGKDPDDDKYIAAAIEGRASFVVSGDPDLLDIKVHEGVRIVNPRAFLDLL